MFSVINPCKQEKRALERKLSEMEEEMKVRNNLHCVYSIFYALYSCLWGLSPRRRMLKVSVGRISFSFLQSEPALMALFSKHKILINCPVLIHLIAPMFDLFCCLIREW